MFNKKIIVCAGVALILSSSTLAQAIADDGLGQTIQINTQLHSFIGKPSWVLIIRDIDHNQIIPYLFDIKRGDNHWVAFTYSRNYLITVSTLQIETYQSRRNIYKPFKTHDFCHLESNGRIMRATSLYITLKGDLSPNTGTYTCTISSYTDVNFPIVNSD